MNLTEQMLLREMLIMLEQSADRVPPTVPNTLFLRELSRVTKLAQAELSAILCLNCQESVNACQCEHTSAGRAA